MAVQPGAEASKPHFRIEMADRTEMNQPRSRQYNGRPTISHALFSAGSDCAAYTKTLLQKMANQQYYIGLYDVVKIIWLHNRSNLIPKKPQKNKGMGLGRTSDKLSP